MDMEKCHIIGHGGGWAASGHPHDHFAPLNWDGTALTAFAKFDQIITSTIEEAIFGKTSWAKLFQILATSRAPDAVQMPTLGIN
jgi:hypothetical protein